LVGLLNHKGHKEHKGVRKRGFTFGIASKVTKSLGPKPPKAEKPDDIPKIRKLATLKQYGFFNGIPPGFSPAERFFRQRPGVTGVPGHHLMWEARDVHFASLVFSTRYNTL